MSSLGETDSPSPPSTGTPRESAIPSMTSNAVTSHDITERSSFSEQNISEPTPNEVLYDTSNQKFGVTDDEEVRDLDSELLVAEPPSHFQLVGEGDSGIVESLSISMLLPTERLGSERATHFQRKFMTMMNTLQRSQNEEKELLLKARELTKKLNEQQKVLDSAEDFPDNANTEVGKLRKQLLQCENELAQSTETNEQLEYELRLLNEERKEIETELQKRPKVEEEDQKLKEFSSEVEDLQNDLKQARNQVNMLKSEKNEQDRQLQTLKKELKSLAETEDKLKDDLVKVHGEPQVLAKACEAIHVEMKEMEASKSELEEEENALNQKIKESEDALKRGQGLTVNMQKKEISMKKNIEKLNYEIERFKKASDTEEQREASLLEERATLELKVRHRIEEVKDLYETVSSRFREKNKEMKHAKAAELQSKIAQEALEEQFGHAMALKEKREASARYVNETVGKLESVKHELEQMRRMLSTQTSLEEAEKSKVLAHLTTEMRLKDQISTWKDKINELRKEAVSHTISRDMAAKDLMKAEQNKWKQSDRLKASNNIIEENSKTLHLLNTQLREYSSAYEIIKAEKNKALASIQHTNQISAELQEKIHILENEIEILRTALENKEHNLQKCSLEHAQKIVERDSLRQDLAKKLTFQSDLSVELEQQRSAISRLLNKINEVESYMQQLRRRYEQGIRERNEQGLKLIERNEELSIFYEKQNLQESIIQKAELELKCRQDDIHFLNMEILELKRAIGVARKKLKTKQKSDDDVIHTQIELLEIHDRMLELEKLVETPSGERLRPLTGSDLSHAELENKVEDFELRVANVEEKLLEKELLHDQVKRITERLENKVKPLKSSGINVAEKVTAYKIKIDETSRKMMALISELSMRQALGRKMQQEILDRETEIERAYTRMDAGDPPTDEFEEEWKRHIRMQETRKQDLFAKKQAAEYEAQYSLTDGTITTAEPRPNAYIPQTDLELPLPKPYGSQAPFRPSQPGASMRHIKKPVLKPIDI